MRWWKGFSFIVSNYMQFHSKSNKTNTKDIWWYMFLYQYYSPIVQTILVQYISYNTCAIITRGLYIFYTISLFSRTVFQKILALCVVRVEERFVIKSELWWRTYGICIKYKKFMNSTLPKSQIQFRKNSQPQDINKRTLIVAWLS